MLAGCEAREPSNYPIRQYDIHGERITPEYWVRKEVEREKAAELEKFLVDMRSRKNSVDAKAYKESPEGIEQRAKSMQGLR